MIYIFPYIRRSMIGQWVCRQRLNLHIACVPQTVTGCRVAMVMMQYSVIANNCWLLVEGLYLHSLLVITVFSERNYFYIYLCIGWGVWASKKAHQTLVSDATLISWRGFWLADWLCVSCVAGAPLMFVLPWMTVKYLYENEEYVSFTSVLTKKRVWTLNTVFALDKMSNTLCSLPLNQPLFWWF